MSFKNASAFLLHISAILLEAISDFILENNTNSFLTFNLGKDRKIKKENRVNVTSEQVWNTSL